MTELVTAEIDPNTVRPGWVALLIVLALGVATYLLWRNMGKQLKKIDFDDTAGADDRAPSAAGPEPDNAAGPAKPEPPDPVSSDSGSSGKRAPSTP